MTREEMERAIEFLLQNQARRGRGRPTKIISMIELYLSVFQDMLSTTSSLSKSLTSSMTRMPSSSLMKPNKVVEGAMQW
jgi:hypothetical protein